MWPTSGIPGSNTAYLTQPNKTVLDQIFDGSVRNSWLITAVLSQNAFTSWTSKVPFLRKIPLEFLVEDRLWVCLRSLVSAETKVGKPIENYSLKSSCIHFSFASTGKMLSGKLIFSFKNGLNLSLDQGRLADGSIMKFGLGFEHLDMTSDGLTLTTVDNRALADKKPVLEFNVSSEYEFPTLKRKAVETSAAAKTVTRPANMKSVTTSFPPAQPEGVKPDGRISAAPSVYEVGSSSATVPLTRAQRKNRSKRLKKILEELDEQRKLVKAGLEDLGDASWLPETSPLLGGSRFHPLSAARGEENVRKIARSPPPAFQDEAESSKKRRSPFAGARSVIQRMADKERTTKSEIMRRMGRAVSDKVKAHILRSQLMTEEQLVLLAEK
ncbi:hypothetical protein IEQ34_025138 [Dendrobium chrysotoxum]|uniref:Uncharacterized protein n=1 Tax=Dendrobium chrysotoxum TaxID=161865 RepID=A0AAV7FR06_DENCH|nr:hypothetical protein IEQ34_025138 [Dendrobium chrysotoxum]